MEPSGSAEAAQGSDAPTTPEAADGAAAVDWRTDGSDFVGRRVYRTVTSEDGFLRRVEGVVVGWLSAAESDFFDACGAPAALYRVAYDGGELADDAEDLEEHEVRESLPTPDTDDVAVAPGDALPLPAAPKRPKPAAAPAPARQLSDYELLRERKVAANRAKLEALGFGAPAAAPKKPPKKKYKKHVFRDDSEFAAPPRRSAREAAVASRSPGAFRDGGLGTLEERRAAREAKARARADREWAQDLAKARKDRAEVAKCLRALVRDVGRSARRSLDDVDDSDLEAELEGLGGEAFPPLDDDDSEDSSDGGEAAREGSLADCRVAVARREASDDFAGDFARNVAAAAATRWLKAPEIVDLLEAHVAGDLPLRRRDYVPPESARLTPARPNSGDLKVLDRRTHLHYLKNNDGATWERWEDQAHGQLQVDGEMRLSFGYARERRRRGAAGPRLVRRVYHLVTAVDRGRSGRGHGDQYDARELHNLKLVHYLEVPDDAANPHGSSRGKARKRARDDDEYEDLPVAPPGMRLMFADAAEANDDVLAWMVDSDDDGDADDAWA